MTEIELLHQDDDQGVILRLTYALEQVLQHGVVTQSPQYLSELTHLGRWVAYRQMAERTRTETL